MSRLLVDTHVLLWWLRDDQRLSEWTRAAIADPRTEPLVSAASVWEIAIKRSLGKLEAPDDLLERIPEQGFGWLPVDARHTWRVRSLPLHHRDPFDRVLVAQALVEGLPVVTADTRFGRYDVDVRW